MSAWKYPSAAYRPAVRLEVACNVGSLWVTGSILVTIELVAGRGGVVAHVVPMPIVAISAKVFIILCRA